MTRKQASIEIYSLQLAMEARPVALSTVYKHLSKLTNGNWHYNGAGYNYTV